LRALGIDQSGLHADGGTAFAVRRLAIEFVRPARMDDLVSVETALADMRGASLVMAQRILRDREVLVTAEVVVAALSGGRPARIPERLRDLLRGSQ
jgi:acyl-CoA thioester hydrolase